MADRIRVTSLIGSLVTAADGDPGATASPDGLSRQIYPPLKLRCLLRTRQRFNFNRLVNFFRKLDDRISRLLNRRWGARPDREWATACQPATGQFQVNHQMAFMVASLALGPKALARWPTWSLPVAVTIES